MSDAGIKPFLQKPGSVELSELYILLPNGKALDLIDYMVEFGLYEDMFNNCLTGYVVISDSRNLVATLPIIGDEYVYFSYKTPDFPESARINRALKVFSITNRKVVRDTNTTLYTLELCAPELERDSSTLVYDLFDVERVAPDIPDKVFNKYLAEPRVAVVDQKAFTWSWGSKSEIKYNTLPTANGAKVITPGWSPFNLINWVASKSLPSELPACNFLFYETSRGYNFFQVEKLIQSQLAKPFGPYTYYGTGIPDKTVSDLMLRVQGLEFEISNDSLFNTHSGYYANQLITIDLFKKKVEYQKYDHVESFPKYTHTNGNESRLPTFGSNVKRSAEVYTKVYPVNSKLFQKKEPKAGQNINQNMASIFGNRHSSLQDLSNLKLRIVIPGRTDLEVGKLIKLRIPNLGPREEADTSKDMFDTLYTGNYLVTSIRHKIIAGEHSMVCEIVTDSLLTTMVVA